MPPARRHVRLPACRRAARHRAKAELGIVHERAFQSGNGERTTRSFLIDSAHSRCCHDTAGEQGSTPDRGIDDAMQRTVRLQRIVVVGLFRRGRWVRGGRRRPGQCQDLGALVSARQRDEVRRSTPAVPVARTGRVEVDADDSTERGRARAAGESGSRVSARTSWFWARSWRTRLPPTEPVAPVTRIGMPARVCAAGRSGKREQHVHVRSDLRKRC